MRIFKSIDSFYVNLRVIKLNYFEFDPEISDKMIYKTTHVI